MKLFPQILWFVLLSLLGFSCTDEHERTLPVDDVAVVFTTTGLSGVGVSSRASNDSWDMDDRVGIYMVPYSAAAAADFSVYPDSANIQYQALSSGTSVTLSPVDGPIFFPVDASETVGFVAYYPYKSDVHTATSPHVYPVDVTTQSPLPAIDLLYHKDAEEYSRNNRDVALNFSHQLSRLVVTVVPAPGVTSVDISKTAASLTGFPRKADFNLSSGNLSNLTDAGDITPVKSVCVIKEGSSAWMEESELDGGETVDTDSVYFEAILIPADSDDYTARTIHLVVNDEDYYYTFTDDFESGKSYRYEFRYTARGLTLGDSQIVNWGAGSTSWNDTYYLNVSESRVSFPKGISSQTLSIRTNYVGIPEVFRSNSNEEIEDSDVSWLTGTLTGSSGAYSFTCSATANSTGSSRTGYLHIKVGAMTVVVEVVQAQYSQPQIVESANCIVLQTNGAPALIPVAIANEAAVFHEDNKGTSATQSYFLPFSGNTASFDVKVLWVDRPNFTVASGRRALYATDIIAEVGAVCSTLNESYLRVTPGSKEGNAVVCITNAAGVIIWSWHIWVVNPTDRATMWIKNNKENASVNRPFASANGYVFFPLHLGAFNASGASATFSTSAGWSGHPFAGLYYQWGRKDPITNGFKPTWIGRELNISSLPFINIGGFSHFDDTNNPTTNYIGLDLIKAPYVFNWSNNANTGWQGTIHLTGIMNYSWGYANSWHTGKSPFDPCPAGWRVPPGYNSVNASHANNAWHGVIKESWTSIHDIQGCTLPDYGEFHPAVGLRRHTTDGEFESGNISGRYWSAGPYASEGNRGYYTFLSSAGMNGGDAGYYRCSAFSVRCVTE